MKIPFPAGRSTILLILILFVLSPSAIAIDGKTMAEDLDNYFLPAFPVIYGEIIDGFPAGEVANITAVLKGIEIFDYIYKIGKIGDSIAGGNADMDTALDAATVAANLGIKLMADEATKKILIAGVGVGTLPLTALITSIDIARSSHNAVKQSKIALDLEILYYTVERDPVIKDTKRELGSGNPIKTDAAAIEHLFRKCLQNSEWMSFFKTYVTSELGQPWPEPSLWDRITVNSDFLEEAAILEEKNRLKSHIASLLLELNKVAVKREAAVVAAKQMQAIEAMAGKISPEELRKALSLYRTAIGRLPGIKERAAKLPEKTEAYKKQMETATAVVLDELRSKVFPEEMTMIVSDMSVVKFLPTRGKDAAVRKELLDSLKEAYIAFFEMKNGITPEKVNERLEGEVKALRLSEPTFKFTRYPCPKFFEDYLPSFEQQIKAGKPGAADLEKTFAEINKNLEEMKQAYKKDYDENKILYEERLKELNERIDEVNRQVAAATDYRERERLTDILNSLKSQRNNWKTGYSKYSAQYMSTVTVDTRECSDVAEEIRRYIKSYENKFQTVESYLESVARDAWSRYGIFTAVHSGTEKSEGYVGLQQMEEIRNIIKENSGGAYAYTNLEFLSRSIRNTPDSAITVNIEKSLFDIAEAMKQYFSKVSDSRMRVKEEWGKWTLSQLKYMGSSKATDDIRAVENAVDDALKEFQQVDGDDVSEAYRPQYKASMDKLRELRGYMASYRETRVKASGLLGELTAYMDRAYQTNSRIETDMAYLSSIYTQFFHVSHNFKGFLRTYTYKYMVGKHEQGQAPPVLSGNEVKGNLAENGVLIFGSKHGLAFDDWFSAPFCEVGTDKGMTTLTETHFSNVLQVVEKLPDNDPAAFYKAYLALKELKDREGIITGLMQFDSFSEMFASVPSIERIAKKIMETIEKKKAAAKKAQEAVDEENNRFLVILIPLNDLTSFAKEQMATGGYASVMALSIRYEELKTRYQALKKTRKDVDEAFKTLAELIETGTAKYYEQQSVPVDNGMEAIQAFYEKFKEAYESRNDYQVMALISSDWEAGDGTTLSDLEMNLSRTFRTFDEIQYAIKNINVSPHPSGGYIVAYEVAITSRMYERDLRHEEKSSVSEMVDMDDKGNMKIVKTLSGRFWSE